VLTFYQYNVLILSLSQRENVIYGEKSVNNIGICMTMCNIVTLYFLEY